MRPLFVVMRRVARQILRDRHSLVILLVQPVVIIAVFGYAFGTDVTDARLGIADMDRGGFGSRIVDRLDRDTVRVTLYATGAEAEAAMRRGEVAAAIVIPSNFTRNIESFGTPAPESAQLVVYQDNTNPQVTGAVLEALGDAIEAAFEDEFDRAPGIRIEERAIFGGEEARSLDFFVPGIAAFAIFQLGSLLTVVAIVKERTLGTLPRLMASPARRWEVVFGYAGAFTLLSLAQAASILAIATFVFGVEARGSLLLALLAATLVGVVALGFGILVSGLARSEFQAVQSVFLFSFPMLFLAGVFAPMEAMPRFLRPAMHVIPLSYAVRALRDVLSYGRGLAEVALDLLVLAGFAFAFLAIATATFGRRA